MSTGMEVFILFWPPEPQSSNPAMSHAACATLADARHEIRTPDLDAMHFDPVSGWNNFTTVKDPRYFKPQIEEVRATEMNGVAPEIGSRLKKSSGAN